MGDLCLQDMIYSSLLQDKMGFVSDHTCSLYSDVIIPRRKVRRRPKLVAPKCNKHFTRARINLNQVWPFIEDQENIETPHHTRSFKDPFANHRIDESQGNSHILNYELEKLHLLNNLNHISSLPESQQHDLSDASLEVSKLRFKAAQIKFYASCSTVSSNRPALEDITSRAPPPSPASNRTSPTEYRNLAMEDLAAVLRECESDIYYSADNTKVMNLNNF